MKKFLSNFLLVAVMLACIPIFASASADAAESFEGGNIVTSFDVSPTDITHTQDFHVSLKFSGQNIDPEGADYIYPGKKIVISIQSDGVARATLNSAIPSIDNTKITGTENAITIEFTDGIQNQYDIEGYLRLTMRGENAEEGSTHTLNVGGKKVASSNSIGGTVGVFAGKTGMMHGADTPGYVTWFLRGNINGDSWPGGPLKIHDELGSGQKLDGNGIEIALYWGGQLSGGYSLRYQSIAEFLASPYGSAKGSQITYDKENNTIDIYIPEEVLSEKEFAFTYDALITDNDLEDFTNKGIFEFYEKGKPDRIEDNSVVKNVDASGGISGKITAWLNINKVVENTNTPIPGKLLIKEIDAPNWISFDSQKIREMTLQANT